MNVEVFMSFIIKLEKGKNQMKKIRCKTFGHTGSDLESGFHVCKACGLHEYWSNSEVMKQNGVTGPAYDDYGYIYLSVIWIRWKIRMLKSKLKVFRAKFSDEVPF